jgi:hypothetical protein
MADEATGHQGAPPEGDELQFERVVTDASSAGASGSGVVCAGCHTSIPTEYYDVNGHAFCGRCRQAIESAAATPRGIAPLVAAGGFGLVAGIAGAIVYYAVMAIAHLEIGIIAILIGYMVGYAVRRGARGRGGRRFQVLAVALTYASIALAYAPMAVNEIATGSRAKQNAAATTTNAPAEGRGAVAAPQRAPSGVVALAVLAGFIALLPILVIVGSFPSGLISAMIIFFGMLQAWRMTAAPTLRILGPYRVGAGPVPGSA